MHPTSHFPWVPSSRLKGVPVLRRQPFWLLLAVCIMIARGTPSDGAPATDQQMRDASGDINQKMDRLETEYQLLEQRLDIEGKSTEEHLKMLTWVGGLVTGVGALLTVLFGIWGFYREGQHRRDYLLERTERRKDYLAERESYENRVGKIEDQRRKDYEKERQFYEERAVAFATLQERATNHAINMSINADERQAEFATQQKEIGNKVSLHTDKMLDEQLANVSKLGEVINLVKNVFTFQLDKETKQQELLKNLDSLQRTVAELTKGFERQYEEACESILKLEKVKAMNWSGLSPEDLSTAARARNIYDALLEVIKKSQEQKNPYRHARMLQLMGITAYYANDIESAFRFLTESDETYKRNPGSSEHAIPRAYTKHFLGVAAKSWHHTEAAFLGEALKYLIDAYETFKADEGQFLTPVTLAEVYSYLDTEQSKASEMLINLQQRLEAKPKLDPNQNALLVRCYLLLGNIAIRAGRLEDARRFYGQAKSKDPQNPFAELSLLHSSEKSSRSPENWKHGLELLERSQALAKRETTTRMTVLVWACVSAYKAGEHLRQQEYQKDFDNMSKGVRDDSDRKPFSFSPLSKKLVKFKELQAELQEFLARDKGQL